MEKIKVLDCFGDICPIPVLKVKKELENLKRGEQFMMVTDHSCVVKSISEKYDNITIEEPMNGVWEITFTKEGCTTK